MSSILKIILIFILGGTPALLNDVATQETLNGRGVGYAFRKEARISEGFRKGDDGFLACHIVVRTMEGSLAEVQACEQACNRRVDGHSFVKSGCFLGAAPALAESAIGRETLNGRNIGDVFRKEARSGEGFQACHVVVRTKEGSLAEMQTCEQTCNARVDGHSFVFSSCFRW